MYYILSSPTVSIISTAQELNILQKTIWCHLLVLHIKVNIKEARCVGATSKKTNHEPNFHLQIAIETQQNRTIPEADGCW